jgi:2-amino-4-hydroxy-6-hydroxymethyldihydropteridine diphosphokinase
LAIDTHFPEPSAISGQRSAILAAVCLGSNLGDRRAHLDFAVGRLRGILSNLRVSRYHETDPLDMAPGAPRFLNAAAVGETRVGPRALLDALLAIERERGRERPYPNAPRTLDLDLVLFGDLVVNEPGLIVPHPRYRDRRFVIEPLAEIAADLVDPISGRSVGDLLRS